MALLLLGFLNKAINDFSNDDQVPWQIVLPTIGTVCAIYFALRLTLLGGEDESPVDITVPIPEQSKNGGRWEKGTGQVWEGKGLKVWRAMENPQQTRMASRLLGGKGESRKSLQLIGFLRRFQAPAPSNATVLLQVEY